MYNTNVGNSKRNTKLRRGLLNRTIEDLEAIVNYQRDLYDEYLNKHGKQKFKLDVQGTLDELKRLLKVIEND